MNKDEYIKSLEEKLNNALGDIDNLERELEYYSAKEEAGDHEGKYVYDYPMTAITADIVVSRVNPETSAIEVLLIKRKNDPYKGKWALPGGFVDPGETAEAGAKRELEEETGIHADDLIFQEYRDLPGRDPRNRTISFVFRAQVPADTEISAGDDAMEVKWFGLWNIYTDMLAFDHSDILENFVWNK